MEGGISFWQALTLSSIAGWVVAASTFDLTRRVRALTQPLVTRRVIADTPAILRLQRSQNGFLDNLFSTLSCVVSVPFYTGFLPILFWSGHSKLARQMTLLMAFCDYIGNSIKDLVSAPRPSCPPVRRVTATADEKENAMEYGLPSSHCLNTVCLLGYLVFYILTYYPQRDGIEIAILFGLVCLLVFLIGIGRVYLGMHSVTDVIAGIGIGLAILSIWLTVHAYIDEFVISGQNVTSFWAGLSFLLAFAYPTPELPTPSFEYHAAFDGVAFGIVTGIQQTYIHFHHEGVPRVFSPQLPFTAFFGRILVGIPTILIVKFCSKAIAKWLLPIVCNTLGIPIISSSYVPMLKGSISKGKPEGSKQSVYVPKLVAFLPQKAYDVDTGIRFLQYAGLAWSVVDLVPSLFSHLNL
ncbi:lipid phosphate phosphatase delta-like [Zingiber officinale]|nr:lipid phosphate phosphatase delta-like [Zingiber officinale]